MSDVTRADKTKIFYLNEIMKHSPTSIHDLLEIGQGRYKRKSLEHNCRELDKMGAIYWRRGNRHDKGEVRFIQFPEELGSWEVITGYHPSWVDTTRAKPNKAAEDDPVPPAQMDDDPMFIPEDEQTVPAPATVQTVLPEEPAKATPEGILAYLNSLNIQEGDELWSSADLFKKSLERMIQTNALPICPTCGNNKLRFDSRGYDGMRSAMYCTNCGFVIPGTFEQCLEMVRRLADVKEGEQ
jgi:hypothetical protein